MKRIVKINNELYILIRKISHKQVNNDMDSLYLWKNELYCDKVLSNGEFYFLVQDINDVKIIKNDSNE